MKSILISGATGLLGNSLVQKIARECTVYALTRTPPSSTEDNVKYLPVDLSSHWDASILPNYVDGLVHLAQSRHFRDFPEKSEDIFHVNTYSTFKLLEYARKVGANSFVHASTGGVYGNSDTPFTEDNPVSATGELGFYVGSKLMSEILAESYASFFNVVTLRPFFVYGPGQNDTMLIPRLCHLVAEEKPIHMRGTDGIKLNPLFVTDATHAVMKSLSLTTSSTVNIAGPEVLTLREIGNCIGEILGKEPLFEIEDGPAQDLTGTIKQMKAKLSIPQVGFYEGVKAVIQHLGLV